jgi:hypothetical protein
MFSGLASTGDAVPSSSIRAEIEEPVPSGSSMGGRLVFATTKAGEATPTDFLVLDNAVRFVCVSG